MKLNRRAMITSMTAGVVSLGGTCLLGKGRGRSSDELVGLISSACEVGSQFGRLNRDDIQKHVADMWQDWRKRGLSESAAVEKSGPFRRFAKKFAPHWVDEAAACAESAGVPVDQFISYLAGKYRSLFFTEDCTSFAASGEATIDGATIFHKNRDNAPRAQSAYYKRIVNGQGANGFFAVGDTSDMGLMMMVNDHGLAGSADMGGLPETHPKGDGVMNPYILRLIAERAETCADALKIIQQMIRDKWYAGGRSTGTHWLFADRQGNILRVAQNSMREEHWMHRDTSVFLARGNTSAAQTLRAAQGQLTVGHFHEAAQSPDLCFGSSISGMTVRIDPTTAIARGPIWVALPAWAPNLPVFPVAGGIPRAVVDGSCYQAGDRLLRLGNAATQFGQKLEFKHDFLDRRRRLQQQFYADTAQVEQQLRRSPDKPLDTRLVDQAAEVSLDAWNNYRRWNDSLLSQE